MGEGGNALFLVSTMDRQKAMGKSPRERFRLAFQGDCLGVRE